jgi:hypothetical protein
MMTTDFHSPLQNSTIVTPARVMRDQGIATVLSTLIKLRLLPRRVQQPVFWHPTLFVLVELRTAIPFAAFQTDDFDRQIGGAFQEGVFETGHAGIRDKHQFGFPPRQVWCCLHVKALEADDTKMLGLYEDTEISQ